MFALICLMEGDENKALPIRKDEDSEALATWETKEEAQNFIENHILYSVSTVMLIDLSEGEIDWL
jgi:hypothetical protein